MCAQTETDLKWRETGNGTIVVGQTSRSGHFNAVSILQFQDLWMSGSMTISSWFVSVQVVFHEQSFCPKGSVVISSINAGEQAELSWPNYAFNSIANCCPSKKISTGKKKANKKLYTLYTFTGMTSFPICILSSKLPQSLVYSTTIKFSSHCLLFFILFKANSGTQMWFRTYMWGIIYLR